MRSRTLTVGSLSRVEGEGALHLTIRKGKVEDVRLRIYEPPRFFEAFLRGKSFEQVPDIVARICGICPVAYQMSSVRAIESAFGVRTGLEVRALRRLLYCGEWIESHALHIHLLHAPDFLGFSDGLAMAKAHKERVETGLRLKKVGNALVSLIGGRSVHPVSVRVGGFYRAPSAAELRALLPELRWAAKAARETLRWASRLRAPDFESDYEFVALRHPEEYPMNEGRLASSRGLDVPVSEFEDRFEEFQVPYSNALHARRRGGGPYLVGPLARFNLNFDRLPSDLRRACRAAGIEPPVRNPFKSIAVRAAEVDLACGEALRIIEAYREPRPPSAEIQPRAGEGRGATEAPRGLLYHRFRTDGEGIVLEAKIVPPTSQNQSRIEQDLREFVPRHLDLPAQEFDLRCEQAVRNHDPCISCATHFLDVRVDRAV